MNELFHISLQISISPRNLYGASNVCQHIYAIAVNNHLWNKRRWRRGRKKCQLSSTTTLKWWWLQIFAFYRNFSCNSSFLCLDLNFIKTPLRSIRTPFRNTEIMTARGFGKRSGEDGEFTDAAGQSKKKISKNFMSRFISNFWFIGQQTEQQNNEDYRDEVINNLIRQKQLLIPFNGNSQFLRSPPPFKDDFISQDNGVPSIKNHRLQIRDGTLKFRLNDGNLRIGRGFGKRSGYPIDPVVEK